MKRKLLNPITALLISFILVSFFFYGGFHITLIPVLIRLFIMVTIVIISFFGLILTIKKIIKSQQSLITYYLGEYYNFVSKPYIAIPLSFFEVTLFLLGIIGPILAIMYG